MSDRQCEQNHEYDRERQALYMIGLLPLHDYQACKDTLALCGRLLPLVCSPPSIGDEAQTTE
jgi:hypothetical protein